MQILMFIDFSFQNAAKQICTNALILLNSILELNQLHQGISIALIYFIYLVHILSTLLLYSNLNIE